MIKRRNVIFCIMYLILTYCCFITGVCKLSFVNFSMHLLFIFSVIDLFIAIHFIVDIKKMYEYIYKYRYLIGLLIFSFLVIFKYNGSSVQLFNNYIQPEAPVQENLVLGHFRGIRSDEWLVTTPLSLTQANKNINFSENNTILSAKDNLVTLNPKLPNTNFFSLVSSPRNIGYLFLDLERAYSFAWYLDYFILFFASFEMLMIITKKNRLWSLIGSVMITLSPVIQWWQSPSIPAYGALAIVLFYYFVKNKNWKQKTLLSLLFGYSGFLYIMCIYPAWQVPYAYCYLILLIWIMIKNRKDLHISDLIYLIPTLGIIIILIAPILISNKEVFEITSNTVYPGNRLSTGGGEWRLLFTYINDITYPYRGAISNPCEFSQYLTLFPIPILYGIYLMIKNKKADLFVILSVIVLGVLSIWVILPLGEVFSKITLLYMSTENRVQVAIGYLSVILIVYLLSKYEKEEQIVSLENMILTMISFITVFINVKISNSVTETYFSGSSSLYLSIIIFIIFAVVMTLFLINNKKTNIFLALAFLLISLLSGALVSPINRGLKILYNKPIAREIQKLVEEDANAIYMTTDSNLFLSNYIAVNGAKTINTTNYIPNLELYEKLDVNKEYADIYNRYEHVTISLTEKETSFILNQEDYISINLNYADICKTNADYLVTNTNNGYDRYTKIYDEYGVKIYETKCNAN